jgi:hypothetical protein
MASKFQKVVDPVSGKSKFVDVAQPAQQAPINQEQKQDGKSYCAQCDKEITGYMLAANGKKYHSECWECCRCSKQFEMNKLKYAIVDGKPWCQRCISYAAPKVGAAHEHEWHEAKSYDSDVSRAITQMARLGDMPLYGAAAAQQQEAISGQVERKGPATNCAACKKVVGGYGITTSKGTFHEGCFICGFCKQRMSGDDSFAFVGEAPHHSDCAKKVSFPPCPVCNQPASGKTYVVKGVKIHPQCYVCAVCRKSLEGGSVSNNNKYYCSSGCKNADGGGAAPAPAPAPAAAPAAAAPSQAAVKGPMQGNKFCGMCGTMNDSAARFCKECGGQM